MKHYSRECMCIYIYIFILFVVFVCVCVWGGLRYTFYNTIKKIAFYKLPFLIFSSFTFSDALILC
jgi:hypothetical protein